MRHIIRKRFWRGRELEAIGAELGVTAERVRQMLKEGLPMLHAMVELTRRPAPGQPLVAHL